MPSVEDVFQFFNIPELILMVISVHVCTCSWKLRPSRCANTHCCNQSAPCEETDWPRSYVCASLLVEVWGILEVYVWASLPYAFFEWCCRCGLWDGGKTCSLWCFVEIDSRQVDFKCWDSLRNASGTSEGIVWFSLCDFWGGKPLCAVMRIIIAAEIQWGALSAAPLVVWVQ